VRIGLKQILLIAAVILFVLAAIANGSNTFDYLAIGLACLAGALVVDELGFGRGRLGRR
jgi:membrane protein DedA with SNARE-associated domain